MKLKSIIFDMDDTVVDWSQRTLDWSTHESKHLERILAFISQAVPVDGNKDAFFEAVRTASREGWMESERGLRAPQYGDSIRKGLQHIGVPVEHIDIDACLHAAEWQAVSGVRAFPDALEILPLLVSHGINIGMITNSSLPMWMRDRELDALGLLKYFGSCRVSAADVGYVKPHPTADERTIRRGCLRRG